MTMCEHGRAQGAFCPHCQPPAPAMTEAPQAREVCQLSRERADERRCIGGSVLVSFA